VGHVGHFVARELHGVARVAAGGADHFALRDERVLDAPEHLLVAHALAPHVVAVLAEQVAHLVVQTVLDGQFLGDNFGDFLCHEVGVGRLDDVGHQPLDELSGEVRNKFSCKQHYIGAKT
jgi:hypothetical protein